MMENDSNTENCAGFYSLSGFPCEVRSNGNGYEGYMYIPGKGLTECNVTTILFEGRPITEQRFKESVINYSRLRGTSE